ncbi:hypothetical protein D3C81_1933220 [compost metagenome]
MQLIDRPLGFPRGQTVGVAIQIAHDAGLEIAGPGVAVIGVLTPHMDVRVGHALVEILHLRPVFYVVHVRGLAEI